MNNSNEKPEFLIDNTTWLILKPFISFRKFINLIYSHRSNYIERDFYLEEIFSKNPQIQLLLSQNLFNLTKDHTLLQIDTSIPRKIKTISGDYFYQSRKRMNLIFTERYWLIDREFHSQLKSIQSNQYIEGNLGLNLKWDEIANIIFDCKHAEMQNFNLIVKNFTNFGRISSMSIEHSREQLFGKKIFYSDNLEYSDISRELGGSFFEIPSRISFQTYLPDKEKLNWTIYKNGTIRTRKMNDKGIEKLIEIIITLVKNKILYFYKDIRDFIEEGKDF